MSVLPCAEWRQAESRAVGVQVLTVRKDRREERRIRQGGAAPPCQCVYQHLFVCWHWSVQTSATCVWAREQRMEQELGAAWVWGTGRAGGWVGGRGRGRSEDAGWLPHWGAHSSGRLGHGRAWLLLLLPAGAGMRDVGHCATSFPPHASAVVACVACGGPAQAGAAASSECVAVGAGGQRPPGGGGWPM